MIRLLLIAAALSFAIAESPAMAQQANRVPVVGVLTSASGRDDPLYAVLRDSLRERGYVEGRTIKVEHRTALGHQDRLPALAEELVQLKVDAVIVTNPLAAQALKHATSTIPMVVALFDPLASGLVSNLAHPAGNVTGLSSMSGDLYSKRLQLMKDTVPRLNQVAVLWNPAALTAPLQARFLEEIKTAAHSLSIDLTFVVAQSSEEFDAAFATVRRAQAQALYLHESALFYVHRTALARLASRAGLPTIYASRTFADEGGLMSYGADYADEIRRATGYVDKILKGAKPGDLPIEQPTKFELVINLKTAKALGIAIPESILVRADEVIR